MKIEISIATEWLRAADEIARRLKLSCRLFALAAGDFLKRQRHEHMLRRLNDVYASGAEPAEKRLLRAFKAKVRGTANDRC